MRFAALGLAFSSSRLTFGPSSLQDCETITVTALRGGGTEKFGLPQGRELLFFSTRARSVSTAPLSRRKMEGRSC